MRLWTFWKLISYIVDVPVAEGIDSQGNLIQLMIRKGQFLLTSPKMIYSYGVRYEVLREAYRNFGVYSKEIDSVLLLGSGIASGVQLLNSQGIVPNVVLVEKEHLICQWIRDFVEPCLQIKHMELICSDANMIVGQLDRLFDLVVVDLFVDDVVPEFVGTETFLLNVLRLTADNGIVIINLNKFPESNMRIITKINTILNNLLLKYYTFEVGKKNVVYGIRK